MDEKLGIDNQINGFFIHSLWSNFQLFLDITKSVFKSPIGFLIA